MTDTTTPEPEMAGLWIIASTDIADVTARLDGVRGGYMARRDERPLDEAVRLAERLRQVAEPPPPRESPPLRDLCSVCGQVAGIAVITPHASAGQHPFRACAGCAASAAEGRLLVCRVCVAVAGGARAAGEAG